MTIDQIIEDAIMALENADSHEQRMNVLLWVYAKGIGAAMRAKGHWPDDKKMSFQDYFQEQK